MHLAPKYGGPTASVPVQCIGTQKLGAEMSIVVWDNNEQYLHRLKENHVGIVEVPHPGDTLLRKFNLRLRRYLIEESDRPDIYHYHGVWLPDNHWISMYGRKNGVKCVLNPRGDLELARVHYNLVKRIKKWIVWHIYGKNDCNHCACIIATSRQEADGMRIQGVFAPIAIIPNGIELSGFPEKIIHEPHEKKVMLFLSRINPIKGLEYLLSAWKLLPDCIRHEWELHIAGNSDPADYIEKLRKIVKNENLQDSVKFIGQIVGEEKMKKYANSDLFILPTLSENFGNVVAEALMCECPVITTKNAPWECLNENHCGWWIDLSVDELKKTMETAMALSKDERKEMGVRGRKYIEEIFASESVAKKTLAVYKWVLGEGPKPEFVEIVDH